MKITVVCDAFGPDNNKTAVAAKALIRAMKERGHEVAVICSDEAKAGKEGYVVISRRMIGMRGPERKELENAIWDSDTVHIMTPSMPGVAAVRLCKQHLIPVSADFCVRTEGLTARLSLQHTAAAQDMSFRRSYMELYRHADAVRFPSKLSRELFEKAVMRQVNAYVIPNGVDEMFRPNGAQKPHSLRDRYIILYRADYSKQKDPGVLIDAAALSKHSGRIQLILAGSGPLKRALKKQGMKLHHQPILTDYPYSQLPNLYNCADLYVHPARVDWDAASCAQALACGLVPLIADSPRSAAKQLAVDAFCLFECGSAQALADKIDRFIEDPEELQACREKYAGITAELTREACMDRMEEMFFDIR